MTFKPFVARAMCCDALILLLHARQFTACPCGKTSVDAGDGVYWRMNVEESAPLPVFYSHSEHGSRVMTRKGKVEE